ILNEQEDGFEEILQTSRSLVATFFVGACDTDKCPAQQEADNEHRHDIVGQRKVVKRSDTATENAHVGCTGVFEQVVFALIAGVCYFLLSTINFFLRAHKIVECNLTHGEAGIGDMFYSTIVEYIAVI